MDDFGGRDRQQCLVDLSRRPAGRQSQYRAHLLDCVPRICDVEGKDDIAASLRVEWSLRTTQNDLTHERHVDLDWNVVFQ